MISEQIFVGRHTELKQFEDILTDPKGQAVLVVGQAGMGKTLLMHQMAKLALKHPNLKCGSLRYEVTPTDSVDSILALMLDHAFDAAIHAGEFFSGATSPIERGREQWFSLLKTVIPQSSVIESLITALRRDPTRNTREQFFERLRLMKTWQKLASESAASFVKHFINDDPLSRDI